MWDIIMARLGKRTCPWCRLPYPSRFDKFYNALPKWVWRLESKLGYNTWVGRVGHKIHCKHVEV